MAREHWRGGLTSRFRLRSYRPQVEVLEGRILPSFIEAASYAAGPDPYAVAKGDLNGDGTLDLVVANYIPSGSSTVSVLLGNGDGSFKAPNSYPGGPQRLCSFLTKRKEMTRNETI